MMTMKPKKSFSQLKTVEALEWHNYTRVDVVGHENENDKVSWD